MRPVLGAAVIALLPAVAAAEGKVDCTDPPTQMEINYCAEQSYLAADAELNKIYKEAMASMKETDSYLEEGQRGAVDALRQAQRAWITFRDKACEAEGYLVSGGSMMAMVIYNCRERLTRQRIGDLGILVDGL